MKIKQILYLLVVIWCIVIFYLSNQTAIVSKNNSLNVVKEIVNFDKSINVNNQTIMDSINNYFREFIIMEYFLYLGF